MKFIGLSVCALTCAGAHAQSISSFTFVNNLTDINTNRTGLSLSLNVGSVPSFKIGSTTYLVEKVWGVWALDDNDDLAGSTADQGLWKSNINFASFGGIVGWKTQTPNNGLNANQSVNLSYSSLSGTVEGFGYHVRVFGSVPGGGNTLHIRNSPVPEPASLTAVGLGVVALIRRRRSPKSI